MAKVYAEEWAVKLQEKLDEDNKWKRICKVEYTDSKVLHNPYYTDPTVATGTRGSAYTHQTVDQVDETIDINTFQIIPQLIDRADAAQSQYSNQMYMAERQGVLLNEAIETAVFAEHAQFTDFDNASIGGGAGNITVSETNIDDIIRGVKREIREADGENLMARNGLVFVWRPADFEMLEAYVQANGFSTADVALENGTKAGFTYMGATHFSSNKLTSGHVFAGVMGVLHLGIVKATYGQVVVDQEPATSGGAVSGIGVVSRVDYAVKAWNETTPVLFDILVA